MQDEKLLEETKLKKDERVMDPFIDRRSGDDRREAYDLDYFQDGGAERRLGRDRRKMQERRDSCIRVSNWSSICPDEIE